jgi:carbamoyltransferase
MLVLGYAGHRRHGWRKGADQKLASRLRHSASHDTIFDAIASFGDDVEDIPVNLFPLDGVGHDGAAAILRDGEVMAAAAEERFNRFKHSTGRGGNTLGPRCAARYCLSEAGTAIENVEHVAFYCDFTPAVLQQRIERIAQYLSPIVKERVLEAYRVVYHGTVSNERIAQEIEEMFDGRMRPQALHFVPHHLAHAASAFYSSGFAESGVLTIDGFGEHSSSIFATAGPNGIDVREETMLPGSLGVLYMMATAYLGFRPLDGEYKVMGLASYGDPKTYARQFERLFEQQADGTCLTTALVSGDFRESFKNLFGPPRRPGTAVTKRDMDIAAALQHCFEEAMMYRLSYLKKRYGIERICMAGGAALNVVMTGRVARSGLFKQTYIFPASGDDGASLGAAQYVTHHVLRKPSTGRRVRSMSLGPAYAEDRIRRALESFDHKIEFHRDKHIEETVADALVAGQVVGWFQGRMEFGPRALGNRSIIADPRSAKMRDIVNERVKLREEFRPFAPAALVELAEAYFDMRGVGRADFMEFVVPATELGRASVQAVVHVDGSARIQTVDRENNAPFWNLISAFARRTGVPVILNTSFNVRGEPIVCTPEDAIRCFLSTQIDLLVLEHYLVSKKTAVVFKEDMAIPALDD